MKNTAPFLVMLCLLLSTSSASLLAQYSVDATVSPRLRLRPPSEGSGGGLGRKLPLQVQIESISEAANPDQSAEATFVLKNIGPSQLDLPTSPHPRDFEPQNPGTPYAMTVLSLYLTTDGSAFPLPGTVELFGDSSISGSMISLPPGGTLTIKTKSGTVIERARQSGVKSLFANFVLTRRAIHAENGKVKEESQDLGSVSVQVQKAGSP